MSKNPIAPAALFPVAADVAAVDFEAFVGYSWGREFTLMTAPPLESSLELVKRHFREERHAEAEQLCRQILARNPNHAQAHYWLAAAIAKSARQEEALRYVRRAVALAPGMADAYFLLAQTLGNLRRFDEAIVAAQTNIKLSPDHARAYAVLGDFYGALRRDAEALGAYERAIALKPDFVEALNNYGLVLARKRRGPEAIEAYQRALRIRPDVPEILANLGTSLQHANRFDEAFNAFRRAIAVKSDYALAYNNIGSLFCNIGRENEALAYLARALALAPDFAVAHNNLGLALTRLGRLGEADAAFSRSLQIDPTVAETHWNRALALLQAGELLAGWEELEWRWKWERFSEIPQSFPVPAWDGADPAGRIILLHAEQGFGDTIQFVRYAPMLARRRAKVIVECQSGLGRLLRSVMGIAQVIEKGEPRPKFDLHLPMMSLPHRFRTTLEDIPAPIAYLFADKMESAGWGQRIKQDGGGVRIGIAWAGSPGHVSDGLRSFPAAALAPLSRIGGVRLYSLQKGAAAAQLASLPADMKVIDHAAELNDFADTAAFIANLDLVITADTAVAHLAGAMGKPVWVMIHATPDWRWMLDRRDSPWYPTLRLFRQPKLGEWAPVVEAIAKELSAAIARGRRGADLRFV